MKNINEEINFPVEITKEPEVGDCDVREKISKKVSVLLAGAVVCGAGIDSGFIKAEALQVAGIYLDDFAEKISGVFSDRLRDGGVAELQDGGKSACPSGMVHVKGEYCVGELRHFCLAGYEKIGSPFKTWQKPGVSGVMYCEKFVEGRAECKGEKKPLDFCIDKFEYPNRDGGIPKVWVSWNEARGLCEAQGKHLCTNHEWTFACEGEEGRPYPYGWQRDESKCNIGREIPPVDSSKMPVSLTDKEIDKILARPGVDLREPSGSRKECVSPFGVYDITGNVDEWTDWYPDKCVNGSCKRPGESVFKGGHCWGKIRNRCRPETKGHGPDYKLIVNGFRCCDEL